MTTARDIVYGAAREMKLVGVLDTPGGPLAADLLTRLNGMLAAWSAKGLTGYTHVTLAIGDTMQTNAALDLYLPAMLAVIAADPHQASISASTLGLAGEGDAIARKLYGRFDLADDYLQVDSALQRMPGLGAGYLQR